MNLSMNNISSNPVFSIPAFFAIAFVFHDAIDILTERGCSCKFTVRKGDISLECELTSPCSLSLPSVEE